MNNKVEVPLETKLKKRFELLLDKKKLIFIVTIIGLLIAIGVTMLLPKKYKADGSIVFKYRILNNSVFKNDISLLNEQKYFFTDNVLNEVSESLTKNNKSISVNDLKRLVTVNFNEASSSLFITAISEGNNYPHEIVNTMIKNFVRKASIKSKTNFLEYAKSIKEVESRVTKEIKENIGDNNSSISTLTFQQDQNISRISELESELELMELENQFYQKNYESIKALLKEKYPVIFTELSSNNNQELNKVGVLYQQWLTKKMLSGVSKKLGNYNLNYPWDNQVQPNGNSEQIYFNLINDEISKIKNDTGIEDSYIDMLITEYEKIKLKVSAIDLAKSTIFNTLTKLDEEFNNIPFNNLDYARELRNKKVRNLLLLKAKERFSDLSKKRNNYLAEIDYVQYALEPNTYFSPNLLLNIIYGILGGLLLGIIIAAFGSENKRIDIVTSLEDLDNIDFKIVSQIPTFPAGSPLLFDSLKKDEIIKINTAIINAFKSIESFLRYGSLEKTLKSVIITSANDYEGKSSIASNVALELANSGNKVLLVDADLKKPNLHKFFKIKSTPSLAHYLFRKKELNEIIRKTQNINLDLITCIEFPQNPSVIITSERMKHFVQYVQDMYDYIIYDTASINALKETIELTHIIDEVILVVRANKTKLSDVLSTKEYFEKHGNENLNIILNDVKI